MNEIEFVIEPGRSDIIMKRSFAAPPEVVFQAITDPELLPRWWGPHEMSTRVEVMEVRRGGRWRFLNSGPDGVEWGFRGVFHDVEPGARLVRTWEFEAAPQEVALETLTLEAIPGGTLYVTQTVHPTIEARDAIIRADGPRGGRESMERLQAVLSAR